jgi:hypothetical protein
VSAGYLLVVVVAVVIPGPQFEDDDVSMSRRFLHPNGWCSMISLRTRCVMMLSALVGLVSFTSVAYAQEQLPLQLKFPLFSQAFEAHTGLQKDSAGVSAIEFADGAWSFRTDVGAGEWQDPRFETAECHSAATGTKAGVTSCQLYTSATKEKKLMTAEGWTCEALRINLHRWEFHWRKD